MFNTEEKPQVKPTQQTPTEKVAAAIDRNDQPSPAISIDDKSSKISVVGDPNEIKATSGDYKLTFAYPAEDLTEEDKAKMVKNEEGDYLATVEYKGKRVKPLYRSKISLRVARIMVDMNVMNTEGYTTETLTQNATMVLVDHIEDLGEIARMTLGIPAEQMEYMLPDNLADFFSQLLDNEPNIMKEAVGFLGLLLRNKNQEVKDLTNEKPNTPQN